MPEGREDEGDREEDDREGRGEEAGEDDRGARRRTERRPEEDGTPQAGRAGKRPDRTAGGSASVAIDGDARGRDEADQEKQHVWNRGLYRA